MTANLKLYIIVCLIVLGIIAYFWISALGQIKVGYYAEPTNIGRLEMSGRWIGGDSPEVAAEKRATINTKYGLFFVLVCAGTAVIVYLTNSKPEKENPASFITVNKPQSQGSPGEEMQAEIASLKAKLAELEKRKGG